MEHLNTLLSICREYNLKVSATKGQFFQTKVKCCGRIIDESGYQLDPLNVDAIRNMGVPSTADKLCQFIHCCGWMSHCTPNSHKISQLLSNILEEAYA